MQDAFSFSDRIRQRIAANRLDELAKRVSEGESEAFDALYSETIDDVFGYIRGQCRNDTLAEDVVANVYLKAWRGAGSYRQGSGNYRRWLFTIARNELVDYWRKDRETIPFDGFDVADTASERAEGLEEFDWQAVWTALAQLTPEQREVVVLRFFNELSHAEIGKILGKREGAVRAQLLRALRQMRKAMNDAAP